MVKLDLVDHALKCSMIQEKRLAVPPVSLDVRVANILNYGMTFLWNITELLQVAMNS